MITSEQKNIAQWALDFSLQKGCSAARVSLSVSGNNSFEYRNEQLDKLHQSTENKLYIEFFVEGKYSSLSTNRLDKKELENVIGESIASTRFLTRDECRQLPDPSRYFRNTANDDLEIFDKNYFEYTVEEKLELMANTVQEVYSKDDRIVSASATYSDGYGSEYMVDSNGFDCETMDTAYSLVAEVALKTEGDTRFDSYWYDSKIDWVDLKKSGIASIALERALNKIGRSKIKSGNYMMLVDNMVSSRLFAPLISAMYGSALQQKNSFLLDKLDTQITSPLLTVIDKPHLRKTFGSRWYDGEGVATKEKTIIDCGVLQTYFIDTYNSLKLKTKPTIASPSVLTLELGSKNLDELIKSITKGVWVTGFNGGNTNNTTGDFSFGIEGFLVENGKIIQPVSEMNITGNMLELWNKLAEIGNDPFSAQSPRQIPSLLFEDISFSGS